MLLMKDNPDGLLLYEREERCTTSLSPYMDSAIEVNGILCPVVLDVQMNLEPFCGIELQSTVYKTAALAIELEGHVFKGFQLRPRSDPGCLHQVKRGAARASRTLTTLRSQDFKSCVSAIPPLRGTKFL